MAEHPTIEAALVAALAELTVVEKAHKANAGSYSYDKGESLEDEPLPFPCGKDAQSTGSWITYFRRYALLASLGMATGEDDDGAKAVPADPVPGFRSSLMAATENLSDAERGLLREWLKEEGLPDRPSKMNAEQADRACEFILHGLPKDPM